MEEDRERRRFSNYFSYLSCITTDSFPLPLALVFSMFFLWGIPNNLNDILIKQFMKTFEISRFEAGLTQSAFYLGYFVFSLPAGYVMRKYSYKTALLAGLFLFGVGSFLFYFAALAHNYQFFLLCLFIIASGLSFLESTSNTYVLASSPPEIAEKRLNFAQSFNPLGSITGIIIGTVFILSGKELTKADKSALTPAQLEAFVHEELLNVVRPYIALAVVVFILLILVKRTKFPDFAEKPDPSRERFTNFAIFLDPQFISGFISQFLYVGAQVSIWSYYLQYVQEYSFLKEKTAGIYLSGTIFVFTVGRFTSTYLMNFTRPAKILQAFSFVNFFLCLFSAFFPSPLSSFLLGASSFFMAPMFPTIFGLGIKNLTGNPTNVKLGGSVMVMSIIGGAIITPLTGWVAEYLHSLSMSMIIPGICFGLIFLLLLFWLK